MKVGGDFGRSIEARQSIYYSYQYTFGKVASRQTQSPTMQAIFKPKHQKLILQCYPSPKLSVAETKPNQAELNYLVFYASSRRTKLEKVGEFLLKKTAADISHKRVGHLKVTLYILQELIQKCSEDLGFMTPYVVTIVKQIVDLGELSSCQLAADVFITYCVTLQPIQRQVFSSDVNLLKTFLSVISKFLGFAALEQTNIEWLKISLHISLVVADYIDPSFSQFENTDLIRTCIYLTLGTLSKNKTDLSLMKMSSTVSSEYPNTSTKEESSIDDLATRSLKSFFDTSSKRQLDMSIKTVLLYLVENNKDIRWANTLIIICTKKSHIELRHRIMIIISNEIEKYVKNNNIEILDYLAKIISNLVSSTEVHFVGLPVLDILHKVIEFEKAMIMNNEAHILKDSYSEMTRSLASRIYYNNQINDMISAILSTYYHDCNNNKTNKLTQPQFFHYSEIIIDNIRDILTVAKKPDVQLKISEIPLSVFNYLYLVIPFEEFPDVCQQIQILWLTLLDEFYKHNVTDLSKPNIESCITNNTDNNLCLFLESTERILSGDARDEIKAQLSVTISTMINVFKLNFLLNYLKFSSTWLADSTNFKYALSLFILGVSSSQISCGEPLATLADSKIAYSQKEHMWPSYIGYKPSTTPSSSFLTFDELYDIIKDIKDISQWLTKINIRDPPSFNRQPPKPHNNVILMSASNSVLSLPIGKQNSLIGSVNGNKTLSRGRVLQLPSRAPSTINGVLDGDADDALVGAASMGDHSMQSDEADASFTSETDYNFATPTFSNSGVRSLRSGWSVYTGRGGHPVNLEELKGTKSSTINETELSRLVRTRTGGTLYALNTRASTIPCNNTDTSKAKNNSGLAYQIAGLDLHDDN